MGTSSFFDYDKMLRRIPRPQTRPPEALSAEGAVMRIAHDSDR